MNWSPSWDVLAVGLAAYTFGIIDLVITGMMAKRDPFAIMTSKVGGGELAIVAAFGTSFAIPRIGVGYTCLILAALPCLAVLLFKVILPRPPEPPKKGLKQLIREMEAKVKSGESTSKAHGESQLKA